MTLQELFKTYYFINVSSFAKYCGINESLMRKYSCGVHKPSKKNLLLIENCIENFCNELSSIKLSNQ